MSPPAGVEARLSALAADDDPGRRAGRLLRAARSRRRRWSSCSPGRRGRGSRSASSGRARTCSSPTTGFRGLVMKLDGELTRIERDGTRRRLRRRGPAALGGGEGGGLGPHRGSSSGSTSPAPSGGAVRMNANAYGGELGRVLESVTVCTAGGIERAPPRGPRLPLPRLGPRRREVVARACFALCRGESRRGEGDDGGDARAGERRPSPPGSRPSARPSSTRRTRAPRDARPASCSTRPAAVASRSAGRGSRRSTRTSSRTPARRPPPTSSR